MTVKRFNFSRFSGLKQQILGLALLLGCFLMGSVEGAAQSLATSPNSASYAVDVKTKFQAKSPAPVNVATANLETAISTYRTQYPSQTGANEALHALRINFFAGIIADMNDGKTAFESLTDRTPALVLDAGRYNGALVTNAALNGIVNEAVALVTQ